MEVGDIDGQAITLHIHGTRGIGRCLVALPGSRCTGGEVDCRAYDAPHDGWLLDYDRHGEVASWSQPAQAFEDGNETTATIEYGEGGKPVGGSIAATVVQECTVNAILRHRVDVGALGIGWADAVYVLWENR